jgi:hypothetical protein
MATLDELAAQFGGSSQPFDMPQEAPEGIRVPWQGLPPRKADEARLRASEQARKKIEENAKVVQQGANVLQDMETFGALNRQSRTGEFYTGIQPSFLQGSDEQEMEAITSRLAPGQRIEGSGTTSDRDIAMFVKAVPSINKKGNVNQAIRDNFAKQYDKSKAKLQYLQDYYDQYGHLNGADTLWEKEKERYLAKPEATAQPMQEQMAQPTPQAQPSYKGLKINQKVNGWKYLGGDPNDQNSWSK